MKELKKSNSVELFEIIDLEEKLDFCNFGCDAVCGNTTNVGCECTVDAGCACNGGCGCSIDALCFNKLCAPV